MQNVIDIFTSTAIFTDICTSIYIFNKLTYLLDLYILVQY